MALSKLSLKTNIELELKRQGFELDGEFAMCSKMATAIANAIINELINDAEVVVDKGSSSGKYKIN